MNNDLNRIKILLFLQWNDKHGCYLDVYRDGEGINRLTIQEAIKYFFGVLNDDFYYSKVDNIFELTYDEVINYSKENQLYETTIQKLNLLIEKENPTDEFYCTLIK